LERTIVAGWRLFRAMQKGFAPAHFPLDEGLRARCEYGENFRGEGTRFVGTDWDVFTKNGCSSVTLPPQATLINTFGDFSDGDGRPAHTCPFEENPNANGEDPFCGKDWEEGIALEYGSKTLEEDELSFQCAVEEPPAKLDVGNEAKATDEYRRKECLGQLYRCLKEDPIVQLRACKHYQPRSEERTSHNKFILSLVYPTSKEVSTDAYSALQHFSYVEMSRSEPYFADVSRPMAYRISIQDDALDASRPEALDKIGQLQLWERKCHQHATLYDLGFPASVDVNSIPKNASARKRHYRFSEEESAQNHLVGVRLVLKLPLLRVHRPLEADTYNDGQDKHKSYLVLYLGLTKTAGLSRKSFFTPAHRAVYKSIKLAEKRAQDLYRENGMIKHSTYNLPSICRISSEEQIANMAFQSVLQDCSETGRLLALCVFRPKRSSTTQPREKNFCLCQATNSWVVSQGDGCRVKSASVACG
jgi:hypothetical protein